MVWNCGCRHRPLEYLTEDNKTWIAISTEEREIPSVDDKSSALSHRKTIAES
jgi:hypothetical protein